ncbi:MAG: hypothetical protein IKL84_05850, partial [Clostridia bacterium]|nr:hypothetical protein [Clostridia bacterium]
MKKKIWIPIATGVLLLAILFLPIPQGSYDDGGTREWRALTYRIVDWNRISIDGVYEKLRVYGPADLSASIDDLWKRELDTIDRQIVARVVYTDGGMALLEALNGGQRYHIKLDGLDDIGAVEGSLVEVWYSGALLYSDPPMIAKVKHWR